MKPLIILGILALLLLAGCLPSKQYTCLEEIATKECKDDYNGSVRKFGNYYDGWNFLCLKENRESTDTLYFSYEEVEDCK